MAKISIIDIGVNPEYSEYINEKIRIANLIGVFLGILSIPFTVFTFMLFENIAVLPVLFFVLCLGIIFCNWLGAFNLSRFIICFGLMTIYTFYHSCLLPDNGTPITSLYALGTIFLPLPWLMFDLREKVQLFTYTFLTIIQSLAVPYVATLFVSTYDVALFNTGWLSDCALVTSLLGFTGCLYFLVNSNYKTVAKNDAMFKAIEDKNKVFAENENKLNEYIKEVEKSHEEEKKRKWASDGLASFAEILRSETDMIKLTDKIISSLVKYLDANQGGVFVLEENIDGEKVLELKSCYAYERKKFFERQIMLGEGLIGQCFLEKETIYMTDIPQSYIQITSGLGNARPSALLIVPLKVNDVIEGVIEIASFSPFMSHQVEFTEKIAESIASVIASVRMNERTKTLLEQSQQQAEEMRAQEEEMRQNLEELMATQEEMQRKQLENTTQAEMMNLIIDNIPFPVFIKDENGRYTLVNKAEAEIFDVPKLEILGYDDSKFVADRNEMDRIRESDKKIVEMNIPVHFPEQSLTLNDGTIKIFKTSKIPFYNQMTGKINILGVSVDLSDTKQMEIELKKEIEGLKEKLMFV